MVQYLRDVVAQLRQRLAALPPAEQLAAWQGRDPEAMTLGEYWQLAETLTLLQAHVRADDAATATVLAGVVARLRTADAGVAATPAVPWVDPQRVDPLANMDLARLQAWQAEDDRQAAAAQQVREAQVEALRQVNVTVRPWSEALERV